MSLDLLHPVLYLSSVLENWLFDEIFAGTDEASTEEIISLFFRFPLFRCVRVDREKVETDVAADSKKLQITKKGVKCMMMQINVIYFSYLRIFFQYFKLSVLIKEFNFLRPGRPGTVLKTFGQIYDNCVAISS